MALLAVISKFLVSMVTNPAFQVHIMGLVGVLLIMSVCCAFNEFLVVSVTVYATFLGLIRFDFGKIIRMATETIYSLFPVRVIEIRRGHP
jgi:hypothetical protein